MYPVDRKFIYFHSMKVASDTLGALFSTFGLKKIYKAFKNGIFFIWENSNLGINMPLYIVTKLINEEKGSESI